MSSGLPFLTLVLGGFAGLAFFIQGKNDVQEAQMKTVTDHAPAAKQRAKKFDINEELERLKAAQQTAADGYENKPVPRPQDW